MSSHKAGSLAELRAQAAEMLRQNQQVAAMQAEMRARSRLRPRVRHASERRLLALLDIARDLTRGISDRLVPEQLTVEELDALTSDAAVLLDELREARAIVAILGATTG